jgi:hypothetical protein
MKKIIIPLLILILAAMIGLYFINTLLKNTPLENNVGNTPTTSQTQDTTPSPDIPDNWITYTSDDFTLRHPSTVKAEATQEGTRFLELGPTQSLGTELFDGLSMLFTTGSQGNQSFEAFTKSEYDKSKNDPTTMSISDLRPVTIAGINGFSYEVSSLGDATVIYLPKGQNEYMRIINNTVEPQNSTKNFKEVSQQMLSTLKVNN